jgi:hypothetical protein
MSEESDDLREQVAALQQEVAELRATVQGTADVRPRGIRRRSETEFLGLPVWEIAVGPDPERGEVRGHARAIFAIGDIATGVFALGGIARGVVCLGGLTLGLFSLGGLSIGLVAALGGLAIGGVAVGGAAIGGVAFGGAALGGIAIGGGAIGYVVVADAGICVYGKGAAVIGEHVITPLRQDPQAVRFFQQWLPWL